MEANQMTERDNADGGGPISLWKLIVVAVLGVISVVSVLSLPMIMRMQGLVWIPSCTGNGGHWGPPEYYRGKGIAEPWDSAPDGWYWVQSGWESSNGSVTFPLCPSSGTRLHGTWNTTVYLPDNYEGYVRVQDQVIVEKNP